MLKLARTAMLLLTLSASVYAGDMQNGVQPPPVPPQETRTYEEPTEVLAGDVQQSPDATVITLNLMQILLALF